jgi:hypothetical protein
MAFKGSGVRVPSPPKIETCNTIAALDVKCIFTRGLISISSMGVVLIIGEQYTNKLARIYKKPNELWRLKWEITKS